MGDGGRNSELLKQREIHGLNLQLMLTVDTVSGLVMKTYVTDLGTPALRMTLKRNNNSKQPITKRVNSWPHQLQNSVSP